MKQLVAWLDPWTSRNNNNKATIVLIWNCGVTPVLASAACEDSNSNFLSLLLVCVYLGLQHVLVCSDRLCLKLQVGQHFYNLQPSIRRDCCAEAKWGFWSGPHAATAGKMPLGLTEPAGCHVCSSWWWWWLSFPQNYGVFNSKNVHKRFWGSKMQQFKSSHHVVSSIHSIHFSFCQMLIGT